MKKKNIFFRAARGKSLQRREIFDPARKGVRIENIVKRKLRFWSIPVTEHIDNCVEKAGSKSLYKDGMRYLANESSVLKKLQEENRLIEAGFNFVRCSEKEQVAIYRKRK